MINKAFSTKSAYLDQVAIKVHQKITITFTLLSFSKLFIYLTMTHIFIPN